MMSRIDESAVRHVAHLARITVTDDEVRLYTEQLSKILEYVGQLGEVHTTDVEPMAHPQDSANVFRADQPLPCWSPDQALLNAPDRHGDFFRVPKVLDQGDA